LGIEDEDIEWAKKQIKQSKPDGKAASRELYEMGKKYHQNVPISQALDALKKHGLNGVDDDGSPWEGMLTGRDGRAHIDLADASGKVVNGMAIQWHKMDSGRYEFNAYLTGTAMHKSQPRIIFLKSHVGQYQRKDGTIVKEHDDKRTKKAEEIGQGRKPAQPDAAGGKPDGEAKPAKYGTHNVDEGDSIKFTAGSFEGAGKVKSVGQDGATVTDESGRDHNVHWHEMHGRAGGSMSDGGEKKPPEDAQDKPAGDEQGKPDGDEEGKLKKMEGAIDAGVKEAGMHDFFVEESKDLERDTYSKFKSWEELDAASGAAQDELVALLDKAGKALGGESVRFDTYDYNKPGIIYGVGPVKTKESASRKVNKPKYAGDWSRLGDLVRGSVGFDSVEEMKDGIEKLKAAGLKLATKADNKFAKPTEAGYRDMNLNILMSNGVVGELQLHLKPMLDAKNKGHKYYEESRVLETEVKGHAATANEPKADYHGDGDKKQARYDELMRAQRKLYGNAMAKALGKDDVMVKALRDKMIVLFRRGKK